MSRRLCREGEGGGFLLGSWRSSSALLHQRKHYRSNGVFLNFWTESGPENITKHLVFEFLDGHFFLFFIFCHFSFFHFVPFCSIFYIFLFLIVFVYVHFSISSFSFFRVVLHVYMLKNVFISPHPHVFVCVCLDPVGEPRLRAPKIDVPQRKHHKSHKCLAFFFSRFRCPVLKTPPISACERFRV